MANGAVITGDIINFTSISDREREPLINETRALLQSWVNQPQDAAIFRGDSYQLLFEDIRMAIVKSIQLICWFKKPFHQKQYKLGTRISIGTGKIAYRGDTVLDSDGEAFHLSGRSFDKQEKGKLLGITTPSNEKNKVLEIILMYVNIVMETWTAAQAEALYLILADSKISQEEIAEKLGVHQSGIAKRLKLAHWKEIEKTINYITQEIIAIN